MEKKKIKLNVSDNFNMKDSEGKIKGIVSFKTPDGRILFKKENMIVKNGRSYISNLINSAFLKKNDDSKEFSEKRYISRIFFGDNSDFVSPDDIITESDLSSDRIKKVIELSDSDLTFDSEKLMFSITKEINLDIENSSYISELGLLLNDSDDSENILFSRLIFKPEPVSVNSSLEINYEIYL